ICNTPKSAVIPQNQTTAIPQKPAVTPPKPAVTPPKPAVILPKPAVTSQKKSVPPPKPAAVHPQTGCLLHLLPFWEPWHLIPQREDRVIIWVQKKPGAPRQEALGRRKGGNGREMGMFGQFWVGGVCN
uniref:Uncharacterized protein n=1 Tax=Cyanoderma ruficeps TaxID=181631 RepID=A0A8C3QSR9_9PASS